MKCVLTLLCFLQFNIISYSQWEPTRGPVHQVVIDDIFRYDSYDYASVKGCGLFKRDITLNTWSQIADYWFENHTLIDDNLFVNARSISGEFGTHFINLKEGIEFTNQIWPYNTPILKHSDSHLYTGWSGAINRSNFDGTDRVDISEGIPPDEITGPESKIKSFELTEDFLLCGTRAGVFISSIENINWVNSSNGLEEGIVYIIKSFENTMYCVVNSNLYRSIDNGQQWTVIHTPLSTITDIHINSNEIYVITENGGIDFSTNQGASWDSFLNENEKMISAISEFDDDLFLISTREGMYKIENDMLSDQNDGLACTSVGSLATDGESLYANGGGKISIKPLSSDWQNISPTELPYDGISSINIMDNTIFISVRQSIEGQPFSKINTIFYSTDQGITWNQIINPVPKEGDDTFRLATNEGRLYASEDDYLYYTEDFGLNWTQILFPEEYCNSISQLEVYNSNLYITTCQEGILKLNSNDEWIDVGQNLPNGGVDYIMFTDEYIFARVFGEGLSRSLIDQDEWETLFSYPNEFERFTDHVSVDSLLFISTLNGVLYSTDNGKTLVDYNENLLSTFCRSIEFLNDTLYVGSGGNAVWKRYVDFENLLSTSTESPSEINIDIFPNPASEWIFIQSDDLERIDVTIIDILGNKVQTSTIDSGKLDIRNLPSGTYFIKFYFNQNLIIEKMIIQK